MSAEAPVMTTLDVNDAYQLALIIDGTAWSAADAHPRYVESRTAPPMGTVRLPPVYMRQLHFVAGHVVRGVACLELLVDGKPLPRDGWLSGCFL